MGRKALVIGIDDYPNAALKCCVNDAVSMSTVLKTHADGSPNFSVNQLTSPSDKIDRQTLKKSIDDLFNGDSDVALLYFSGHGVITNTGGYIVATDYAEYSEGVSMDEILVLANKSKAKERIIIFDCCYSGTFGSPELDDGKTTKLSEGMTVLTASRKDEPAIAGTKSSLFTSLLIEALNGGASDIGGNVSPGGIYAFVDKALGEWKQRPIFKTNVSRFTSLRNTVPPVSRDVLRKLIEYFPTPEEGHDLDPSYEFTNDPDSPPQETVEPYADSGNVEIMKNLQKFVSVGLVKPVDAEHMYFAAMDSKSCCLTALGNHYWQLVKDGEHI